MENKYICPRCGKQMKLNNNTNVLSCKGIFCGQEISLAEYLLSPDINMILGMTKRIGDVLFLINSKDKNLQLKLIELTTLIVNLVILVLLI